MTAALRDLHDKVCKEADAMTLVYDLEIYMRFRQRQERGIHRSDKNSRLLVLIEGIVGE